MMRFPHRWEVIDTYEANKMNDHDALLAIQEILDGVEWSADTLPRIAEILESAGYRVRDLND